jgi:hypothetical protein
VTAGTVDFIGIGGQRCGTTWLFANLRRHPGIRFPAGKEVHYWDSQEVDGPKPWLDLFGEAPAGVKQGEITPSYAILPDNVVAEVAAAVPEARLFLSIRNPLERSWSAALLFLARCQMDPAEASDAWFLDVVGSWRCRAKSTFSPTIDTWRLAFGEDRLHLIVHDDISTDPSSVMRDLATHIGVDPSFYDKNERALRQTRGIVTRERRSASPAVIDALANMHAGEIAKLAALLGRDLSHWLDWDGS